jgi:hypothetical protein
MTQQTRRQFIGDVGKTMVAASVGFALADDLLPGRVLADGPERLSFGDLEPLVGLMQETPADRLVPAVVERLRQGTELRRVVAAAALANARAFGGEDYVGFHTMMAIAPSYHMAGELPAGRRALPVLKVLFRNSSRIQESGHARSDTLRPVEPAAAPPGRDGGEVLRDQVRAADVAAAERTFAGLCRGPADDAFNHLLTAVEDGTDVHRVVLPYRAWDLLGIIGRDQAHTLLRQSVRFCVNAERPNVVGHYTELRALVPRLLDRYGLLTRPRGTRAADDAWVDRMSRTIFGAAPPEAASAVADALAEGMSPDAIGEAISLAANQLVLRDPGRSAREAQPNKPGGSVHGDSVGVHASDSVNAWRYMSRLTNPRNRVVCLLLGAYHVARDRGFRGRDVWDRQEYPSAEALAAVRTREPAALLRELDTAVRGRDQMRASAVAAAYGAAGLPARAIFDLLLTHAIANDGALHAEKYYRTVTEEFAATRPAFRWRQVVALARVTASAYGFAAPGYDDARRLLGASADERTP